MKRLEADIIRANESEIVLSSDVGIIKWFSRIGGLLMVFMACGLFYSTYDMSDYLSDAIGGYCSALCIMVPLAIVAGQAFERTTVIQFNQPPGHLTIKESPWWTILIPAGPYFIKVPTLVPLPQTSPFVENQSGYMTYPVQTGPNSVEMRQSYVNRFQIQLPLPDGKIYTLWTTDDHNTYVEIVKRVNKAIQDYHAMKQ